MSKETIKPFFSAAAREGWGPEVIKAMDERECIYQETLAEYGVENIIYLPPEVQERLHEQLRLDIAEVIRDKDV